jgi:hypothetical protein
VQKNPFEAISQKFGASAGAAFAESMGLEKSIELR